jgi:hypothetical protein
MENYRSIYDSAVLKYGPEKEETERTAANTKPALKLDDLESPDYINDIKDYMIDRKGKHFSKKNPEEIVDAFMNHMRFFNTNEAFTLAEAMYINKADPQQLARAGKAFEIYDKVGNVFVNDGLAGAVGGVKDYIFAIASSPSTYVGLGAGKLASLLAGKGLAASARKQALNAYKSGLARQYTGTEGAKKLTFDIATKMPVAEGTKELAEKAFQRELKRQVRNRRLTNAMTAGGVDAGVAVGQDMVLQDLQIEAGSREAYDPLQTGLAAGASMLGTTLGLSSLPRTKARSDRDTLTRQLKDARRQQVKIDAEKMKPFAKKLEDNIDKMFRKKEGGEYFRAMAARGEIKFRELGSDLVGVKNVGDNPTIDLDDVTGDVIIRGTQSKAPVDFYFKGNLVSNIIGNRTDGTFILDAADEAGIKLPFNYTNGSKIALLLKHLPDANAKKIRETIFNRTGLHLGDITDNLALNISSTVSRSIQNAAETLVSVQGKKLKSDAALIQGAIKEQIADRQAFPREFDEVIEQTITKADELDPFDLTQKILYGQNLWKRMIVSAPQTTAVNIYGFGQYATGQALAELFATGMYGVAGLLKGANLTEAGRRDLEIAKLTFSLQGQKLKNLADPYTTYDSYMEFLKFDPKLRRQLFDTFSGGVERTFERFKVEEAGPLLRGFESVAEAAANVSGVRLQDTVTKSQMFMSSIDKELRIRKQKTFMDVIKSGDLSDLDDETIGSALEETMKSVFSADYTKALKKRAPEDTAFLDFPTSVGRYFAKGVETISNLPGMGFILPFGRFMNSVVAYSYNWGPTSIIPVMAAIERGAKRASVGKLTGEKAAESQRELFETMARATTSITALGLAINFQRENEKKGLAWNEIELGGGDIVDITNVFPVSLLMAMARYINVTGLSNPITGTEYIPPQKGADRSDLRNDLLKQMAIGQTATDLSFGNDLTRIISEVERAFDQGDNGALTAFQYIFNGSAAHLGNIGAGYTRPLDPVNRLVGYALGTDTIYDKRIANSGLSNLSLNGLKYVDNIIEGVNRYILPESLGGDKDFILGGLAARKASREGDLYDPNPIMTLMGGKFKQPRTFAEMAFAMINKPDWKTSMYTGIPEHDNFVNSMIAPQIEQAAELLMMNENFTKGSLRRRQRMIKNMMQSVRAEIRDQVTEVPSSKSAINYKRLKLDRGKTQTDIDYARDVLGIDKKLRDMSEPELDDIIDFLGDEDGSRKAFDEYQPYTDDDLVNPSPL